MVDIRSERLTLIGPTVVLRVPDEADVAPLWGAVRDSAHELGQWMSWFHDDYSEADVRSWTEAARRGFDADDEYNFVVIDRDEGTVLGACGLNKFDCVNRSAHLGYWVRTPATGRGAATESAALVTHWALGELGLNRLEVVVATANGASLRVAEKLGAVREGVARSRLCLRGAVHDGVVFSLVASDLVGPEAIVGGSRDEGVSSPA